MKYKKIEVIARVVGAVAAVASVVVAILALQNRDIDSSVISPEAPSPTGAASQDQNRLLNTPPVVTTSPLPNSLRSSQTTVNKNKVSNDDNDDKDDRNERDSND